MALERVVLHVGMGKCGSTAIQQYFQFKRHLLPPAIGWGGFFFEGLPFAGSLPIPTFEVFAGMDEAQRSEAAERIAAALDAHGASLPSTLFVSNEAMFDDYSKIQSLVNAICARIPCKLVVFMRNPEDWLWSSYLQWGIKHKTASGRIPNASEWAQANLGRFTYAARLREVLQKTPQAELAVISYDDCGDVVARVLRELGVQAPVANERVYATPSLTAHALMKLFNDQSDEPVLPGRLADLLERAGVTGKDYRRTGLKIPPPSGVMRRKVRRTALAHREVLQQFMPPEENPRFYAEKEALEPSMQPDVTSVLAALIDLVLHLDRRVNELEKQL